MVEDHSFQYTDELHESMLFFELMRACKFTDFESIVILIAARTCAGYPFS